MSVCIFTPPFLHPGVPPLPPLDVNTHAGIHLALAMSNFSGGLNSAHRFIVVSLLLHVVVKGRAIIVILIVINIFFSSFNNADPSHIMLVDCCMLCCLECGPITAVWRWRPPWLIYSIAFSPILPSFLSRHTQHNSAKPKSNHKPTNYPTKYLRQYSADEDILSTHPLRMYGGQTPVLYGGTYSLSWGWRFMVNREKWKKLTFYTNKISRWAVAQQMPGQLGSPGYQIDPHNIPGTKHCLLLLIWSI